MDPDSQSIHPDESGSNLRALGFRWVVSSEYLNQMRTELRRPPTAHAASEVQLIAGVQRAIGVSDARRTEMFHCRIPRWDSGGSGLLLCAERSRGT